MEIETAHVRGRKHLDRINLIYRVSHTTTFPYFMPNDSTWCSTFNWFSIDGAGDWPYKKSIFCSKVVALANDHLNAFILYFNKCIQMPFEAHWLLTVPSAIWNCTNEEQLLKNLVLAFRSILKIFPTKFSLFWNILFKGKLFPQCASFGTA